MIETGFLAYQLCIRHGWLSSCGLATGFGRLRRETPTAAAGESPPSHRVMSLLRSLKERVWKKQLGDCGRAEETR
jgi:hypothetical protein